MGCHQLPYSDEKVANRNARDFRWEVAPAAVSQRPPISLSGIVARIQGCTCGATVWALSLVQGPFPVAPCQTQQSDSQLLHRCTALQRVWE